MSESDILLRSEPFLQSAVGLLLALTRCFSIAKSGGTLVIRVCVWEHVKCVVCGTHGDGAQVGSRPMMKLVFLQRGCDFDRTMLQVDPACQLCVGH